MVGKFEYEAVFTETVSYTVRFKSNVELTGDEPTEDWFSEMDKSRPDWPEKPDEMQVEERMLQSLERINESLPDVLDRMRNSGQSEAKLLARFVNDLETADEIPSAMDEIIGWAQAIKDASSST